MSTDFLSAAVAAAVNSEKRIADVVAGKKPCQEVTSPVLEKKAEKESVEPVAEKELSNGKDGIGARSKKRRARIESSTGSNWKKLKATIDSASAEKQKKQGKRARHFGRRVNPSSDKKKTKAKEGEEGEKKGAVEHSQFTRGAVAARDGKLTRVIALDCEMVEVGGNRDALARVSVVNVRGDVVYDRFVKAEGVVDYRTEHSGVRREDLESESAADATEVRKDVGEFLKGRILVGHALQNDLRALALSHPHHATRDTSVYFRRRHGRNRGGAPKLAELVASKLGVDEFQKGEHDAAEDARAALALYKKFGSQWEAELRERAAERKKGNKKRRTN